MKKYDEFTDNANTQYNIGFAYEKLKNYKLAKQWYSKSADKGFVNAEYNLGVIYLQIEKNDKEAKNGI